MSMMLWASMLWVFIWLMVILIFQILLIFLWGELFLALKHSERVNTYKKDFFKDYSLGLLSFVKLWIAIYCIHLTFLNENSLSEQGSWTTVETRGAVVNGVYGHTAVWDPVTALVYVHGGLLSIVSTSHVVPYLMTYDPIKQKW